MCGVIGAISLSGNVEPAAVLRERIGRGVAALRHRGPDGCGIWSEDGAGLGHARLAVVDLEGGAQPLRSDDGQTVLVINGELYDHAALRQELTRAGHSFRTRSDSEVALHLYRQHGLDFLHKLRGEFALLLWDARRRLLVAARDRFGVKPLCYAQTPESLLLASEGKALLAMGVSAAWESEAVHQALSLQYLLPEQTLLCGVRQLPPGHVLLLEGGRPRLQRYWDLDLPRAAAGPRPDERALGDELLARLDEAVRQRLQADVPVSVQLSGGLDSSVVAGLAARAAGRLTCFTVSFPGGAEYDERRIAERTAEHCGADLRIVQAEAPVLWDALPAAVAQGEGLAINLHIAAKYLLSAAVRQAGYRVILTGEGADEILAGYAHLRRDLEGSSGAAKGTPDRAGSLVTIGVHLPEGESLPLTSVQQELGWVPSFLQAKGTLGYRLRGLLTEEFRQRWVQRDAAEQLLRATDVAGQLAGRHRVDQAAYLWTKQALAGYILRTLGDGMEMAHGVEGRLPFLDPRVFELARVVPIDLKIHNGIEKHLLREAALRAGVVTDEVARRAKHPFMAPPLGEEPAGARFLQDWLRSSALEAVPFFDAQRVRALLDTLPKLSPRERVATDPVLMLVLTATLLQAHYRLGQGGTP